ncbi:MAG TPA: type I polyketide synthase, partial [Polyangiales bacterium]|nr:type I polyketide synthase [Polyangiales bacterium]
MTPAHGLRLFELALTRSTAPHQVLWTLQPSLLQKTFGVDVPAMWRGIVQPKPVDTRQRGELSESLARLPVAARHARVVELLCDDAASVLGLRAAGDVPSSQPLRQLGLDSLMALELRNRIGARFQCRLSPSLLFDHPTLDALGRYLLEHVLELRGESAVAPAATSVNLAGDEAIAIVSMACRFPAGIDSPEALWNVLAEGRDLVEDIPAERWDISALFDADPDAPGKTYARQGGFVRDVDKFDAAFFEIAPREARAMDPQQRLLLETAWEALERAGVVPASLNESLTGVYIGMFESGYFEGTSLDQMDGYSATGSTCSVASGRLAYTLGLQGPAITVDTACSS